MDTIEVACPNGHTLTGAARPVGRMVRCPKCAITFKFELPAHKLLTETGVLRLLGDVPPDPSLPPEPAQPKDNKSCPRCGQSISVNAHVCEFCKCFVGAMPKFLSQMIADGKSGLGNKRRR